MIPQTSTGAPPAGPHGGDGARLASHLGIGVDEVLDLSASLNPVAPNPAEIVSRHLPSLRRYPDPGPATEALARAVGAEPRRIVLTNGGAEAIALVAALTRRGRVEDPEFSLYRRHLVGTSPDAPLWRSNPHNPTGRLADPADDAGVWDEAFWPLATGTWTRGDADGGSFVVGSLTKLFACPGLRAGYVICPEEAAAAKVRRIQPQWALNGLAAGALPEMLAAADLPAWAKTIADLRSRLVEVLRRNGLEPRPSDANWVLVDAAGLRDRLAAGAIAVRDCANFGMPGTVRIAVPDETGLARLEAAL